MSHDTSLLERNRATRADIRARISAGVGRASRVTGDLETAIAGPRPGALQAAGRAVLKERFIRFALASSSTLVEVATLAEVPGAVASYLQQHQLPARAAIWASLGGLDWTAAGLVVEARAANADDAIGITGVFCALAETGTVLTLSGHKR